MLFFSLSESALERILRCILNSEGDIPKLRQRIAKMNATDLQSKTMSIADQFKLEGRLSALRSSVLRALEIRHGAYPNRVREAIEAIEDLDRLERPHESAVRSESLEAFTKHF